MDRLRHRLGAERPNIASRQASQLAIDAIAEALPNLLGGRPPDPLQSYPRQDTQPVRSDFLEGRYIHYGVREFGMAAAMNGVALHGGFIPYGGTFLFFADYSRAAIRLSALMRIRVIYVMTMIPSAWARTVRPISRSNSSPRWAIPRMLPRSVQATPLRPPAPPGLRAAGAGEPVGLVPVATGPAGIPRKYLTHNPVRIASMSSLSRRRARCHPDRNRLRGVIALEAAKRLAEDGVRAAVVSAPCFDLFRQQSREYRAKSSAQLRG